MNEISPPPKKKKKKNSFMRMPGKGGGTTKTRKKSIRYIDNCCMNDEQTGERTTDEFHELC